MRKSEWSSRQRIAPVQLTGLQVATVLRLASASGVGAMVSASRGSSSVSGRASALQRLSGRPEQQCKAFRAMELVSASRR